MTGFNSKREAAADKLQEPVAWRWGNKKLNGRYEWRYTSYKTQPDAIPLYSAPPQPAQEPVGTLNISRYKGHLVNHDFDYFGELPDGTYSVYTTPPLPVQEPMAHTVIAGALFDFMGYLTSLKERIVLSAADDAAPAADHPAPPNHCARRR